MIRVEDDPVGGIDLNLPESQLEIVEKDKAFLANTSSPQTLPFNLEKFEGFTFTILQMRLINNLSAWLAPAGI